MLKEGGMLLISTRNQIESHMLSEYVRSLEVIGCGDKALISGRRELILDMKRI